MALQANKLSSLTVVHIEVLCCFGLTRIAKDAIVRSGPGYGRALRPDEKLRWFDASAKLSAGKLTTGFWAGNK